MDPEMLAMFLKLMQQQGAGVGTGAAGGAASGLMSSPSGGTDWKQTAGSVGGGAIGAGLGTLVAPGIGTAVGAQLGSQIGGSLMGGGKKSPPTAQEVFRDLMRKQYPIVSQSEDRLAAMGIREASRGAGAAGMNNSAVLQSIRDASVRQANQNKASARDQMLQQAFDITGAQQKASAFKTMMQSAGRGGSSNMGSIPGLMGGAGPSGSPVGTPGIVAPSNGMPSMGAANTPQATGAGGGQLDQWLKMLMGLFGGGGTPAPAGG